MLKLSAVVYLPVASMAAGSLVIAALSMGRVDAVSIAVAAIAGAVIGLPASWLIAGRINTVIRPR
ncbi:hypothetical protein DFR52_102819 [Hoeflea marina]|uniref:CTP synthetase n=1 Tax=Hoeflea marina TaxID=274592 RepID=A0A317PPE6_9HYPH|nr:hypothetical protein DFR52_102819 [Hoeflea marina]